MVYLVYPRSLVQPNKRDRPDEQDRLADFSSLLLGLIVSVMQASAGYQAITPRSDGLR